MVAEGLFWYEADDFKVFDGGVALEGAAHVDELPGLPETALAEAELLTIR